MKHVNYNYTAEMLETMNTLKAEGKMNEFRSMRRKFRRELGRHAIRTQRVKDYFKQWTLAQQLKEEEA